MKVLQSGRHLHQRGKEQRCCTRNLVRIPRIQLEALQGSHQISTTAAGKLTIQL